MGEFADDALWRAANNEDDYMEFKNGGMSVERAYDLGIIDELGFEAPCFGLAQALAGEYSHRFRKPPIPRTIVTCRKCGGTGFYWSNVNGGWVLTNPGGTVHDCPSKKEEQNAWNIPLVPNKDEE